MRAMAIICQMKSRYPASGLARPLRRCPLVVLGVICLVGCSNRGPTTQPSTISERQEQALRDPFGYNPDFKKTDMSVSGQNDPDGLKRDLHDVFNP